MSETDADLREEMKLKLQSRLWELMRSGVEPADICARLGKPPWYIWEHLSNRQNTRLRTLFNLAFAMGCKPCIEIVPR